MLSENIKAARKSKGLSQEELAIKINVVRQTISMWEKGLSTSDCDMLMALAEALKIPVSVLLGETIEEPKPENLKAISEKLEVINLQLAKRKATKQRLVCWGFTLLAALIVIGLGVVFVLRSPYLGWDYSNPETAVIAVGLHAAEWLFVRVAPFTLAVAIVGVVLTRCKGR